eukprot:m.23284 g.23284  ORF g.23284 m.23284 type:complete len:579 (+) comp8471_c0_seq2:269-2005(+)
MDATEAQFYSRLFDKASEGRDVVGAGAAVTFLRKSNLPDSVLHKVWELSDVKGVGSLDLEGFQRALKLIACAQGGHPVEEASLALATEPASLGAEFQEILESAVATTAASTGSASPQAEPASQDWDISAEDKAQYDAQFDKLEKTTAGTVAGAIAKQLLLATKLPKITLGQIWEFADMDKDGELDRDEYAVVMHLVKLCKGGADLPDSMPASLIPPSKRGQPSPTPAQPSSPATEVQDTSSAAVDQDVPWKVSSAERKAFEKIFLSADKDKDGLVSGKEAAKIFQTSKLPKQQLAHIWSLADIYQTGTLNSEQFALAMHLVSSTVKGNTLPRELTPELRPPSCRDPSLTAPVPLLPGKKKASKPKSSPTKKKSSSTPAPASTPQRTTASTTETTGTPVSSVPEVSQAVSAAPMTQTYVSSADLEQQDQVNQLLRKEVAEVEAEIQEQEGALSAAMAELQAKRREEADLRKRLNDGKAKIRTLIANLQSTTKSLQRVDEVNSRLQHSTRKVDEALVKYSQAEAIAPGVAHESSKGNGMADPFGALARPPPSTSRRQPSQRPSRTQVKAPAAAADPWAPQ